jgi:hypothetical protein
MGMKRFTSHSRTPTTMSVRSIERRGILVYLSVFAARHLCICPNELLRALPGAQNRLNRFHSRRDWTIDSKRPRGLHVVPQRCCGPRKSGRRRWTGQQNTPLCLRGNFVHPFSSTFSRLRLRGATQKLLRYFLRSFEHVNTDGQPRRNAPFPHAREIRSRLIKPSQTIAILRGTRDIFALQLRQPRKK